MLDMAATSQTVDRDEVVKTALVATFSRALRLATYILRDPVAAQDAVQEAAVQAWDSRGSLRDPKSVEVWFSRILVNVCRRELRRRLTRQAVGEMSPSADGEVDRLSQRDEIERALQELNAEEQLLLALRYGRDLTVPQIAALAGMREGTVKSRLHRALEHLRAVIDAARRMEKL